MTRNCSSLAIFLSMTVRVHVHSVTHGHFGQLGACRPEIALCWIGHSTSLKVILIGVSINPERRVVVLCNNVDLNSETYENVATWNLQICRFQPPNSAVWRQFSNKCIIIIIIIIIIWSDDGSRVCTEFVNWGGHAFSESRSNPQSSSDTVIR